MQGPTLACTRKAHTVRTRTHAEGGSSAEMQRLLSYSRRPEGRADADGRTDGALTFLAGRLARFPPAINSTPTPPSLALTMPHGVKFIRSLRRYLPTEQQSR